MSNSHLESTCKQFIDSLMGHKVRHTLCLNIEDPSVDVAKLAGEYVQTKGAKDISQESEPTPTRFAELLANIEGKVTVAHFDDLDKSPKCIDLLVEHVRKPHPGGHLIVVSRHWNSDNTEKERELRKFCLFFQQNLAKKARG
ncbi:hypothetical protein P2318_00080 [Myxococcaceae bacterium GXIMD 01537]